MDHNPGFTPSEQPKGIRFSAHGLYDTIYSLYPKPIREDDPEFIRLVGSIFNETIAMICNGCMGMQYYNEVLLSYVATAGIDFLMFKRAIDGFVASIEAQLVVLSKLIDYWRYHKVVDISYKLDNNYDVTVKLYLQDTSRDYVGILRKEVENALANNEPVPLKYLIMVGLA